MHAPPARRFGALVVEDEKKIRTTLAKRLEEVGCSVRGVTSAETAREPIAP
jgi:CheY-like chemotaxis protein